MYVYLLEMTRSIDKMKPTNVMCGRHLGVPPRVHIEVEEMDTFRLQGC